MNNKQNNLQMSKAENTDSRIETVASSSWTTKAYKFYTSFEMHTRICVCFHLVDTATCFQPAQNKVTLFLLFGNLSICWNDSQGQILLVKDALALH